MNWPLLATMMEEEWTVAAVSLTAAPVFLCLYLFVISMGLRSEMKLTRVLPELHHD